MCALTGLHVVVATLINREFLIRGDTDAQFAPTWYHLGELVRDGQWPPMLDPDSWHGGNYAAEALFGIYNPRQRADLGRSCRWCRTCCSASSWSRASR